MLRGDRLLRHRGEGRPLTQHSPDGGGQMVLDLTMWYGRNY